MNIIRKIFYRLSPSMRMTVRRLYYLPYDLLHKNSEDIRPPKGLIYVGRGDYKKQGESQVELLKKYANLSKSSSVLDIGCGIGRLASALTKKLSPSAGGEYYGFDVVEKGIEWCNKNIASSYKTFHFSFININNPLYNDSIGGNASSFSFPYEDGTFDAIASFSVFTHMLENDVERYFSEIRRVLKNDGVCVCTFSIIDDMSLKMMKEKKTYLSFPYAGEDGSFFMDNKLKEGNVAFTTEKVFKMAKKTGVEITQIKQGAWRGIKNDETYQDLLIIKKSDS